MNQIFNELILQHTPDVRLIYKLANLSFDFNAMTTNDGTLLHFCLMNHPTQMNLFHALLQCGADMMQLNMLGESAYYKVILEQGESYSEELKSLFKQYYPGVWSAVAQNDIQAARKAINLWCRVDLIKNDTTLRSLAYKIGNPDMITLISNIEPSLKLAHYAMADDASSARSLVASLPSPPPPPILASSSTSLPQPTLCPLGINANLRNMGAYCSTPLCYAIQYNNLDMVELLLSLGASLDFVLELDDESELPVMFLALRRRIGEDILEFILNVAKQTGSLERLRFRSGSALHFAVEENIQTDGLGRLVNCASAKLLAARDQFNFTAFDLCSSEDQKQVFIECLEQRIESDDTQYLLDLVANGYDQLWEVMKFANHPPSSLSLLTRFEKHITKFNRLITSREMCSLRQVQRLLLFHHDPQWQTFPSSSIASAYSTEPISPPVIAMQNLPIVTQPKSSTIVHYKELQSPSNNIPMQNLGPSVSGNSSENDDEYFDTYCNESRSHSNRLKHHNSQEKGIQNNVASRSKSFGDTDNNNHSGPMPNGHDNTKPTMQCNTDYQGENNDMTPVVTHCNQLSHYSNKRIAICVANCRVSGDGQPPLHKAVLHASVEIVHLICSVIVGTLGTKIDKVRDQMGRTALCYAYLVNDSDTKVQTLIDFGSSEFTVDKDNRSPTGFRDQRSAVTQVAAFLQFHRASLDVRQGADEPSLWPQPFDDSGKDALPVKHKIHAENCRGHCSENQVSKSPKQSPYRRMKSTQNDDDDDFDDRYDRSQVSRSNRKPIDIEDESEEEDDDSSFKDREDRNDSSDEESACIIL